MEPTIAEPRPGSRIAVESGFLGRKLVSVGKMVPKVTGERMAAEHSGNPAFHENPRWPTALASLALGAAFFALWFWLLPKWLSFTVEMAGAARGRWLAAIPSVLGFAVALRCVWDFGWTGRLGRLGAKESRLDSFRPGPRFTLTDVVSSIKLTALSRTCATPAPPRWCD
jgi:hypothetical protein